MQGSSVVPLRLAPQARPQADRVAHVDVDSPLVWGACHGRRAAAHAACHCMGCAMHGRTRLAERMHRARDAAEAPTCTRRLPLPLTATYGAWIHFFCRNAAAAFRRKAWPDVPKGLTSSATDRLYQRPPPLTLVTGQPVPDPRAACPPRHADAGGQRSGDGGSGGACCPLRRRSGGGGSAASSRVATAVTAFGAGRLPLPQLFPTSSACCATRAWGAWDASAQSARAPRDKQQPYF
eukprot:254322-Chlamydomonas_euryale.AAC.2